MQLHFAIFLKLSSIVKSETTGLVDAKVACTKYYGKNIIRSIICEAIFFGGGASIFFVDYGAFLSKNGKKDLYFEHFAKNILIQTINVL